MGKRRIHRQIATLSAGADKAFESIQLALISNVLIHKIFVGFPADNAFTRVYVKRQDRLNIHISDTIAEEYGLDNGCTIDDKILLTFNEYSNVQVYIGEVLTTGTFKLNIDYEEVS